MISIFSRNRPESYEFSCCANCQRVRTFNHNIIKNKIKKKVKSIKPKSDQCSLNNSTNNEPWEIEERYKCKRYAIFHFSQIFLYGEQKNRGKLRLSNDGIFHFKCM